MSSAATTSARGSCWPCLRTSDLQAAVSRQQWRSRSSPVRAQNHGYGHRSRRHEQGADRMSGRASKRWTRRRNCYESRQQLFEQGALARRLVDEANVAFVQARSQYEIAAEASASGGECWPGGTDERRAKRRSNPPKAKYQGAQAQLSYSEIRSPIAGIVADRPLYAGEMASAGTPLLTIVNISRVIARANIPVDQAASVKVGRSCRHYSDRRAARDQRKSHRGESGGGSEQHDRGGLGGGR